MLPRDRSAPGVRVVAVPHARASSGLPIDLRGRVVSFSFEDCADRAAQASLELDNFDLAFFDQDALVGGSLLEVSWGYPGAMATPRRLVVKRIKGFQTLSVEARALSVLMSQQSKTRSWTAARYSDIAHQIAAEQGFVTTDIELSTEATGTVHQAGESDAQLLRRLAAELGFVFDVDETGFQFHAARRGSPPTHVLTWYSDPGRGEVMSVHVDCELGRRAGRVEVRGRDPIAKRTITASATHATAKRPTLAEVVEVVDPETGSTALQQRNATASIHPSAVATPMQAAQEADARYVRAEQQAVNLSVQVVGDPTLRAKAVVEMRGISRLLSGKYYVNEARHVISSQGYTVELKLSRDGTGLRRDASVATEAKAEAQTNTQRQRGEPNRSNPASPGMPTIVEHVDPEDGRTLLEYRYGGQLLGAEDPEAGMSLGISQ